MHDAHDRRSVLAGVAALALAPGRTRVIAPAGPPRARALVAGYAAHVGTPDRTLSPDDDVAFGQSGLHYDRAHDVLLGRAFAAPAYIKTASPEAATNYRRVAQALNDPAIGGMFERAGGYFVLDDQREAILLVRAFPVPATDAAALIAGMERLQDVAAVWSARWIYRVAMIVGGHQPRPTHPVTLADPG